MCCSAHNLIEKISDNFIQDYNQKPNNHTFCVTFVAIYELSVERDYYSFNKIRIYYIRSTCFAIMTD